MNRSEIAEIYCTLMEELKARVDTMHEIAATIKPHSNFSELRHAIFQFEGLYLHLRKTCELLALSVLVVHQIDDRSISKKLAKEWQAERIFRELRRVNSIGFPKPIATTPWVPGEVGVAEEYSPVFTADDLCDLYVECGKRMHVGSLKDIQNGRILDLDQQLFQSWCARLQTGLGSHMVVIPNAGSALIVRMSDPDNGHVSSIFAQVSHVG